MTRHAHPSTVALDPNRIAAGTGAIALNGAMLLLLLVPITVPPMLEAARPAPPDVVFIDREKPKPDREPEVVAVRTPARPQPRPQVVQPQPPKSPAETSSHPEPGDIVVPPGDMMEPVDVVTGSSEPGAGEPMHGAHLEYAIAPPPPYPRAALREGLTGTVMLQVLVDVDGRPLEVTVRRSSGHRELDVAARRQVLSRWTFRPAIRDGRPVQAIGVIPVEFKLD